VDVRDALGHLRQELGRGAASKALLGAAQRLQTTAAAGSTVLNRFAAARPNRTAACGNSTT
jgi:hypothetical protein